MTARSFLRLRVTRDLPRRLDNLEYTASPPFEAGEFVYAWTGQIIGTVPDGERPVTLEPGHGPWFSVPADAVKEA